MLQFLKVIYFAVYYGINLGGNNMNDSIFIDGGVIEEREFTIETPMGSVSSDSGNHLVDVISVVGIVIILYAAIKVVERVIKK
jgi:hypothetical protein